MKNKTAVKDFVEEVTQREEDLLYQIQKQRKCIENYDVKIVKLIYNIQ